LRIDVPKVLTANRLARGEVVYWNASRGWVGALAEADVVPDAIAEQALAGAAEWVQKREVVAPYLFDVRVEGGKTVPVKVREVIRAKGPTVRPDLGKQAD
jgi:hypothetical protein